MYDGSITISNLELINSNSKEGKSLIEIIDHTLTPMGSRKLKRWLIHPQIDIDELNFRHDTIEDILKINNLLISLENQLDSFADLRKNYGQNCQLQN